MIKPLLAILSPRDLDFVKEAFDAIDYVDKLWVKYMPMKDAYNTARNEFLRRDYTHLIVSSDDITPSRESVAMLMLDAWLYDFPVVSGCCRVHERSMKINITVKPVRIPKSGKIYRENYPFLWIDALKNPRIIEVWFVGFALTMIRRDVVEKIPFRAWDAEKLGDFMYDLSFSYDCAEAGIKKYADLRVFSEHYPSTKKHLLVGKREPKLVWEKAKNKLILLNERELESEKMITIDLTA